MLSKELQQHQTCQQILPGLSFQWLACVCEHPTQHCFEQPLLQTFIKKQGTRFSAAGCIITTPSRCLRVLKAWWLLWESMWRKRRWADPSLREKDGRRRLSTRGKGFWNLSKQSCHCYHFWDFQDAWSYLQYFLFSVSILILCFYLETLWFWIPANSSILSFLVLVISSKTECHHWSIHQRIWVLLSTGINVIKKTAAKLKYIYKPQIYIQNSIIYTKLKYTQI